jgi:hypothetical protein
MFLLVAFYAAGAIVLIGLTVHGGYEDLIHPSQSATWSLFSGK